MELVQRKCCVPNCEDWFSKRHRFPRPDRQPELFKLWFEKVGNPGLKSKTSEQIYKSYRVCHVHFKDEFKVVSHRGISTIAYPTLFLPEPCVTTFKTEPEDSPLPSQRSKKDDDIVIETTEPSTSVTSNMLEKKSLVQQETQSANMTKNNASHFSLTCDEKMEYSTSSTSDIMEKESLVQLETQNTNMTPNRSPRWSSRYGLKHKTILKEINVTPRSQLTKRKHFMYKKVLQWENKVAKLEAKVAVFKQRLDAVKKKFCS